jgi:signal transduction histidine kinase
MKPARVIIVEDNSMVAEDLHEELQNFGYQVVGIAATGESAIEQATEHRPDLLIMDVRLAGEMDGIEAATEIHRRLSIPVVFLSAYSDETLLERTRQSGAFGYLVKPYSVSELRTTIEVALYKAQMDQAYHETQKRICELEKAQSLARMAGAVAHNNNNMLAAVLGNIELALEDLPPEAPVAGLLESARDCTLGATRLGKQMLACLGQTFGKRTMLDLTALCQTHIASTRQSAQICGPELATPICIQAHAHEVEHILEALIDNALDAMKDHDGQVRVRLYTGNGDQIPLQGRAPVDFMPGPGPYACIDVSDTGCGIAADRITSLFEPFYTTKFTGRGLGLPVALGLTRAYDGCITVESKPDRGSRFRVWLPTAPAPADPYLHHP